MEEIMMQAVIDAAILAGFEPSEDILPLDTLFAEAQNYLTISLLIK